MSAADFSRSDAHSWHSTALQGTAYGTFSSRRTASPLERRGNSRPLFEFHADIQSVSSSHPLINESADFALQASPSALCCGREGGGFQQHVAAAETSTP